eukprot:TRINITY_DN25771_c0_g1_i1.p1 TRINITY_DN25771_c0_g1~~TRINITY_DN25771_c0_g1_i1.p1  ORF type:complete len:102 (+),score=0.23 TRINITY_DN25771_c0_g1_i1:16-321(+)
MAHALCRARLARSNMPMAAKRRDLLSQAGFIQYGTDRDCQPSAAASRYVETSDLAVVIRTANHEASGIRLASGKGVREVQAQKIVATRPTWRHSNMHLVGL